jgi:hypothetical protein
MTTLILLKEKLQNIVFFIVFLSAGDCAKYHPIFEALKIHCAVVSTGAVGAVAVAHRTVILEEPHEGHDCVQQLHVTVFQCIGFSVTHYRY